MISVAFVCFHPGPRESPKHKSCLWRTCPILGAAQTPGCMPALGLPGFQKLRKAPAGSGCLSKPPDEPKETNRAEHTHKPQTEMQASHKACCHPHRHPEARQLNAATGSHTRIQACQLRLASASPSSQLGTRSSRAAFQRQWRVASPTRQGRGRDWIYLPCAKTKNNWEIDVNNNGLQVSGHKAVRGRAQVSSVIAPPSKKER